MKVIFGAAALGLTLMAGSVLAAGTMTPQQVVDGRVAGMKGLGGNLQAAQKATDPAVVKAELAKAIVFADSIPSLFPMGTGLGDAGVTKTRALPDIWTKNTDFKAAAEALSNALKSAHAAVGDPAKFDAALGDVTKACKGCHLPFRGKAAE